jgi:hypothetical protein
MNSLQVEVGVVDKNTCREGQCTLGVGGRFFQVYFQALGGVPSGYPGYEFKRTRASKHAIKFVQKCVVTKERVMLRQNRLGYKHPGNLTGVGITS